MQVKQLKIMVEQGIHARRAAVVTKLSNKYLSNIYFRKNDLKINAKSIIGIMMLALAKGCTFEISAEGIDEEVAIEEIGKLMVSSFTDESMLG